MKLSEIKEFCSEPLCVISDCGFDSLYLLGKAWEDNRDCISFVGAPQYIEKLLEYDIKGVICTKDVADILAKGYSGGIVISSEPKKTFFEIHIY